MGKEDTFKHKLTLMIRTTIDKKRHDVGTVEVPYPTLHDVNEKLAEPDRWSEADEDGNKTPIYDDEAEQWAQDAILDSVKREARNVTKVVGPDKDGKYSLEFTRPIPQTFAQLCEEHARQGGEYLKIRHEAIADFGNWLTSLNKSQGAMDMAKKLFSDPAALDVSPVNTRQTFLSNYLAPYVEQLKEDAKERFEPVLAKVITSAESDATSAEDF